MHCRPASPSARTMSSSPTRTVVPPTAIRHVPASWPPTSSSLTGEISQQATGNHQPLDLAGALVELGDLGVAVVALDGELLRVAVAAEDLDRLAGLASRDRGGEQLGLRALDGVRAARLLEPRGSVG